MASPNITYTDFKYRMVTAQVNWTNSLQQFYGLLLVGSVSPTAALDPDLSTVADLLGEAGVQEANGAGYVRTALTGRGAVKNLAANTVTLSADPLGWDTIDVGTVQGLVVFENGANDSLRNLCFGIVNGFPKATNGAPFNILFPTGVAVT